MSSVFKTPKVVNVKPEEVQPVIVDDSEEIRLIEGRRKKKMGAISQMLSRNNSYGVINFGNENKTTLGG